MVLYMNCFSIAILAQIHWIPNRHIRVEVDCIDSSVLWESIISYHRTVIAMCSFLLALKWIYLRHHWKCIEIFILRVTPQFLHANIALTLKRIIEEPLLCQLWANMSVGCHQLWTICSKVLSWSRKKNLEWNLSCETLTRSMLVFTKAKNTLVAAQTWY